MSKMITISDIHEWLDKKTPDCRERRMAHLMLERLLMFEVGQVPELKGKLVESNWQEFIGGDTPE
jgi:hypothetical protein